MSMQILKSSLHAAHIPSLKAAPKVLEKLDQNSPLGSVQQDIFQQLQDHGVQSKLGWDSLKRSTYIRTTLINGKKLERIYFPKKASPTAVFKLEKELSTALTQAQINTNHELAERFADAASSGNHYMAPTSSFTEKPFTISPAPNESFHLPLSEKKPVQSLPQPSKYAGVGAHGTKSLDHLRNPEYDPIYANLFETSYRQVASTFIGATDHVLRKAASTQNPSVLFLARDGIGGFEIAKQLLARFPHRYPGLNQDSIHYIYLNKDTIFSPHIRDYLRQEGKLSYNSSVFLSDIGWQGTQSKQFADLFKGELGRFQGLHLMFSPNQNKLIQPYINIHSNPGPFAQGVGGNPAVHFLEDTFSGLSGRPQTLRRDYPSGKVSPEIPPATYTGQNKAQREWALKALTDASADITETELKAITPKTASRTLYGLLNKPEQFLHLMVPHEKHMASSAPITAKTTSFTGPSNAVSTPTHATSSTPQTMFDYQPNNGFGTLLDQPKPKISERPEDKTLRVMHAQLETVTPQDISKVLEGVKHRDQRQALTLLGNMTQFGNMKSVEKLFAQLNQLTDYGSYPFYVTRDDSLAGVMNYLAGKQKYQGAFRATTFRTDDIMAATRGSILLDKHVLQQLADNPELLAHIKSHDFRLFYPDGFDEGFNFLHAANVVEMKKKMNSLLALAQSKGVSIDEVTSYNTKRTLTDTLGLYQHLTVLKNKTANNTSRFSQRAPQPEEIAANLAPIQMDSRELPILMSKCPNEPEYRAAVMELLQHESHIFSPQRMASMEKAKRHNILQAAENKGINPDKILYYVPKTGKSYSLMAMQHTYVNPDVLPSQVITDISKLPKTGENMVVILDDLAGSGQSLKVAYNELRTSGYKGPVFISPTVSTTTARKMMKKQETRGWFLTRPGNMQYSPAKIITPFKDSALYQNASPEKQKLYLRIMNEQGFDANGLSIVFPHHAPDNCNSFFTRWVAPKYLLNGQGAKALKQYAGSIKSVKSTYMPFSMNWSLGPLAS